MTLEAVVRDATKSRRVRFKWHSKEPSALPAHWWKAIIREVSFQQEQEARPSLLPAALRKKSKPRRDED